MRKMSKILLIFITLFISTKTNAQMLLHPDLKEKIRKGEVEFPYTPERIKELRAKGIDSRWDSPIRSLIERNKLSLKKSGSLTKYNALVVLVDFPDKPFKTPAQYFDSLLFSGAKETLSDFINEITYGNLSLSTANLPSEVKVVRAPQAYSYYCGSENGMGNYPHNSQKLVEDVIAIIDPSVDFSKYDNDGDHFVDAFFIVHSGSGYEKSGNKNDIWSHAWSINAQYKDRAYIYSYSIEPEYWSTPGDMTFGVYAHEMGHAAFGLPDLYDTDYTSEGIGNWSLMSGGSWNGTNGDSPAHPDVWCKAKMGLVNPVNIVADTIGLNINAIEGIPQAYRIWKNGVKGSEYFLIENRQKVGYDKALPGSGLLIYHVDENIGSNNNEWYDGHTKNGHLHVAIEQADGKWDIEKNTNSGDSGDSFPGSTYNYEFSSSSVPNNKAYDSTYTYFSISNIKVASNVVTTNIKLKDYLAVSKNSINAGDAEVNTVIDTTNIQIKNIGPTIITINGITNHNTDFTIQPDVSLPYTLKTNEHINAKIIFAPTTNNVITDSLIINYNDNTANVKEIPIVGNGYVIQPAANNVIYGVIKKITKGSILTINSSNGSSEVFGNPTFITIKSIAISNHTKIIYGLSTNDNGDNQLIRINAQKGDAYYLTTLDKSISSVSFDSSGTLYGATSDGVIYKIDFTTGKCDSLIHTGLKIFSIAFNPLTNELYSSAGTGSVIKDAVYKINIKTADTVLIGRTGFNTYTQCLAFDANGILYGIKGTLISNGDLIKIDPQTATGTLIGSTGLKGFNGIAIYNGKNTSDVENNSSSIISKYSLEQNYPNPFNPSTTISYNLPVNGLVKLKVYDILGKEVAALVNEVQNAGIHNYKFSIDNYKLSSGIYFYSLQAGDYLSVKKMILLK